MTPEQWQQVREAYEAVAAAAPDQRAATLAEVCGDDAALRAQVERLLDVGAQAGDFLERPPLLDPAALPAVAEGRRLGPYQILREIGQGGMSTVYLAVRADAEYEQQVAIKLLWPGLRSRDLLRRFRQERQILADLDHPNIARLLDGGTTEEGWPYLVMEYIEGMPITHYCREKQLALAARLKLFRTVCAAVEYAHRHLIVHRDLKPSNILVTENGTVKLLDFGIAKLLKPDGQDNTAALTQSALHLLTPDYASPEQIRNEEITPRSDVYSLGVLLYELLTGVRPYQIKSLLLHEITRAICEVEPERPSHRLAALARADHLFSAPEPAKLRRQLAGDLDNIVMMALAKDAARRYPAVGQLSEDIARHLAGEPVAARRATWAYRVSRFVRRYPALVTATALLLLSLLGGLLATWLQMRRAETLTQRNRQLLYAAQMSAAQQALESANVSRVRELLAAQAPQPGEADRRGWEWYYLWRQTHLERATLPAEGEVNAVAFSPDSRLLAAADRNHTAWLWEAETGRELFRLKGHADFLWTAAFSPDGRTLATGGSDQTVKLWEVETGRAVATLRGHTDAVRTVTFSPDGKLLATSGDDATVRLWAVADRQEIAVLRRRNRIRDLSSLPNRIRALAFSPDGRLLATGDDDTLLTLWDVTARRKLFTLAGHDELIWAVAFAPDGKSLATGSEDETVRIWDLAAKQARLVLKAHQGGVNAVAFSPDSRKLITGSSDRTAQLWDAATGQPLATLAGHGNRILAVAFSPDGGTLATGSADRTVKLWEVASTPGLPNLHGHQDTVWGLAFSPDGHTLATGCNGGSLRLWETATGQTLRALAVPVGSMVKTVAFSPDGRNLVSGQNDGSISLWPMVGGDALLTFKGHSRPVRSIAFSPDGQTFATAGEDHEVKLWAAATGQGLLAFKGHTGKGHTGLVMAAAFSPDGRLLATGADDNLVKLWDAAHREVAAFTSHTEVVNTVAFSLDGRLLATGSGDRTIKLWDVHARQELATLKGHVDRVWRVAFSPDGQRLATASSDKTVKLWEVATGLELISIKVEAGVPRAVAFSPDGQFLALSGDHGVVKLWRAATAAEVKAYVQP